MSRIGNKPVVIPSGVTIQQNGDHLVVQGPKGHLTVMLPHVISVTIADQSATVTRKGDSKNARALHGTIRAHLANAVHGVENAWKKKLKLVGVGYRAQVNGKELTLSVGFSHPVKLIAPEGIEFKVADGVISITGINKELVGENAAKIRKVRPPEPYKGKGIRYVDEIVRKKAGKSAKAVGGAPGA